MNSDSAKEYAAGLREYADFVEAHPEMASNDTGSLITIYGFRTEDSIYELLHSHPSSAIEELKGAEIDYLHQQFGALCVKYVLRKDAIRTPAIVDGKVVYALKERFNQVPA